MVPTPYNVTFEPNESGTEAKVTWLMIVDYVVSYYVIELSGSLGSKSYAYVADKYSPTTFTVPLYSGLYHPLLLITLYYTENICDPTSSSFQYEKTISYFSGRYKHFLVISVYVLLMLSCVIGYCIYLCYTITSETKTPNRNKNTYSSLM